jgi:hypothetical protein
MLSWDNLFYAEQSPNEDTSLTQGPREVPFIAQYRKEEVGFPHILNMHGRAGIRPAPSPKLTKPTPFFPFPDLWLIDDWDHRYSTFIKRKETLVALAKKLAEVGACDCAVAQTAIASPPPLSLSGSTLRHRPTARATATATSLCRWPRPSRSRAWTTGDS